MIAKNVKTRRDYLKQHSSAQGILFSSFSKQFVSEMQKNNVYAVELVWFSIDPDRVELRTNGDKYSY